MNIIAIDPGIGGAIAKLTNNKISIFDMPKKNKDIASLLYQWVNMNTAICYIEHIQAREFDKIHISSSMKLMKNYGICLGACYAYDAPVKIINPTVWMSGFIQTGLTYSKRKNELFIISKKIFPKIKIKKSQADAMCLLAYAMKQEGILDEYFKCL